MSTRREFILRVIAAPATPLVSPAHASSSTVAAPVTGGAGQAQTRGRVTSYDHVALPMLNVDAMTAFYKSLGFRIEQSSRFMSVHFGDQKINFHMPALWRRDDFSLRGKAARPGCGDLCFVWDGTAAQLKAMLDGASATIVEGPVERAGGRKGGSAKGTSMYCFDPDGNLLEFMRY